MKGVLNGHLLKYRTEPGPEIRTPWEKEQSRRVLLLASSGASAESAKVREQKGFGVVGKTSPFLRFSTGELNIWKYAGMVWPVTTMQRRQMLPASNRWAGDTKPATRTRTAPHQCLRSPWRTTEGCQLDKQTSASSPIQRPGASAKCWVGDRHRKAR